MSRLTSSRPASKTSGAIRRVASHWRPLVRAVHEAANVRLVEPSTPPVRLGRYEVERLIGCGGMGIVFQARDPELARSVALKLWNLDAEEAELALRNEAQCQAQISHPNVVTLYETGKVGSDMYLAMEYVEGKNVSRWLESRDLAWQEILAVFVRAGQGLAAVHERGLVHGDFKPENILLSREGRVLVADFGLARAVGELERDSARGKVGGTRVYMAPERLEGRLGNAWSDQFSFCVALWECLHGVRPYTGTSATELLDAIAVGKLRAGPAAALIPRQLRAVLEKGLDAEPSARWESMGSLVRELSQLPNRLRRRRLAKATAVVGVVAALMVGVAKFEETGVERESSHEDVGINSDRAATLNTGSEPERLNSQIAAHIAADEFDQAVDKWRATRYSSWVQGVSSEELSLDVARALHKRAEQVAAHEPELAFSLASYAHMIASSVLPEPSVKEESVAAAQRLQAATLELMLELAGRDGG